MNFDGNVLKVYLRVGIIVILHVERNETLPSVGVPGVTECGVQFVAAHAQDQIVLVAGQLVGHLSAALVVESLLHQEADGVGRYQVAASAG